MVAFIVRRLFIGVIILLLVTMLVFLVMRLLPGDPLTLYLAQSQVQALAPDQVAELRHKFGLDQSLPKQYIDWIGGVLHGDLGQSVLNQEDVGYEIKTALPKTIYIGVLSFVISSILGVL
jgi:peptide/nickel transport system permease protein